ncbi:MAG: hypothetical protein K6D96_06870 [Acetatifactor sp.]|nr:hypothetical protein [Acetatifactor sp.]
MIKKYIWDKVLSDYQKAKYLYYIRSVSKKKCYADYNMELIKNREFKGIHKGERVFILGNGPSLCKQDLSLLRDDYVMTTNYASKLGQFDVLNTDYHFCLDSISLLRANDSAQSNELVLKMFDLQRNQNKMPTIFVNIQGKQFVERNGLDKKYTIRYLIPSLPIDVDKRLPVDITRYVPGNFCSVVQWAIYTAIYMGFSEIYLLGVDCTNIISDLYERTGKEADNKYAFEQDEKSKDMNKKINTVASVEDCFRAGFKQFEVFRKIKELCEMNGVLIYNCTDGGLLDCIERKKYEELFE